MNEIKADRDRFSGILRFASEVGNWQIHQISSKAIPELIRSKKFSEWNADGIIGQEMSIQRIIGPVKNALPSIPVVCMDVLERTQSQSFCGEVCLDDRDVSRAAADLLLRRGLENFAYVGDVGRELDRSRVRESCFRKRVEDAGFSCSSFQPGKECSKLWFEDLQPKSRLTRPLFAARHAEQLQEQLVAAYGFG